MSDTEDRLRALMLRGLSGDSAAHAALLRETASLIRPYFARRLNRHSAYVEDLVQETLIAVHVKRETYLRGQPLLPWVYAIARYRLIDFLRRQRLRYTVPLELAEDAFSEENPHAGTAVTDVDGLMSRLPEKQRRIIAMVKLEGLSVSEAAARTGYSPADIKVSIHRGLKRLREHVLGRAP